ncbi:MAG: peptidase MA family metallohydrolase [Planctomycetota bacterium]
MTSLRTQIVLWIVLTLASSVSADVIVLKNGNEIRGRVKQEFGDTIEVELPYGSMMIERREVREIRREDEAEYLKSAGEQLLAGRDVGKGLEYLRRAHREAPDSNQHLRALVNALAVAGRAHYDQRRHRAAQALVEEGLRLAPEQVELTKLERELKASAAQQARLSTEADAAEARGDFAEAHARLKTLRELWPEDRELYRARYAMAAARLGHQRLEANAHQEARDFYFEALCANPDLVDQLRLPLGYAALQVVLPKLQQGEMQSARRELLTVFEVLPDHPAITYCLAITEESCGNLSEAAELYSRLAGPEHKQIDGKQHLASLRQAAEAYLADARIIESPAPTAHWATAAGPPGILKSKHFDIRHSNASLGQEVGAQLEEQLKRYQRTWFRGTDIGIMNRVTVQVHGDRPGFLAASGAPAWSAGMTQHERRFGKVISQTIHFLGESPQLLTATLPHELSHVLLPHLFGAQARIPLWLDEGIATNEEPAFKQLFYARTAREALADETLFPLSALSEMTSYPVEDRTGTFYAQCNSLVSYIYQKLGRARAFELFRAMTLTPLDVALRDHSSFVTLAHLEQSWRRWLAAENSPSAAR